MEVTGSAPSCIEIFLGSKASLFRKETALDVYLRKKCRGLSQITLKESTSSLLVTGKARAVEAACVEIKTILAGWEEFQLEVPRVVVNQWKKGEWQELLDLEEKTGAWIRIDMKQCLLLGLGPIQAVQALQDAFELVDE